MVGWSRCEREFGPLLAEREAGALSSADAAALAAHLEGCARCRERDREIRDLVRGLREAAEGGLLEHPDPARLADLLERPGELPAEERAGIERHLAACGDCRAEWNVAGAWRAPAVVESRARPRPASSRWGWFAAGALTAAAVASVAFVAVRPPAPPALAPRGPLEPAGVPVPIRGAHHRAESDVTPLAVAPGAAVVLVAVTVEAAPGSPLALRLLDADGRTLASADLVLEDPMGRLLFSVHAASLPERGEFQVEAAGTGERFHYPFRVEPPGDR